MTTTHRYDGYALKRLAAAIVVRAILDARSRDYAEDRPERVAELEEFFASLWLETLCDVAVENGAAMAELVRQNLNSKYVNVY